MGTLRQAVADAYDFNVIGFAPNMANATITLTSGDLAINKRLTIDGSALSSPVRITAVGSRVIRVLQENVVLDSLIIEGGKAPNATVDDPAERGGGVINFGEVIIKNCTIQNSKAGDGGFAHQHGAMGGGITNVGDMVIENSTIANNEAGSATNNNGAGGSGGGIENNAGSTLTIINSTIYGNSAGDGEGSGDGGSGGGIVSQADLTLINTTITQNTSGAGASDGSGGGLRAFSNSSPLTIENTVIADNAVGGSDYGDPYSDIRIQTPTMDFTSIGVNLIGINDGGTGAFPAPLSDPGDPNSNGDLVGTSTLPFDAKLGAFGNTGGITQTVLPMPDSPLVDPIDGQASSPSLLTTDQRGFPRVSNGIIDIGAVEFDVERQAARDAAAAAALATQQAAAVRAALQASYLKKIKKFKKKFKAAKRKGQIAKAKKLKKKFKKFRKKLKSL